MQNEKERERKEKSKQRLIIIIVCCMHDINKTKNKMKCMQNIKSAGEWWWLRANADTVNERKKNKQTWLCSLKAGQARREERQPKTANKNKKQRLDNNGKFLNCIVCSNPNQEKKKEMNKIKENSINHITQFLFFFCQFVYRCAMLTRRKYLPK